MADLKEFAEQLVNLTVKEVNDLADYIVGLGDVQKKKTNVKAPMSDWHLNENNHLVDRLCNKSLEIISMISNEETNFNAPRFYIRRCWGAAYGKGDWTKVHNHGASAFGWCYYVLIHKETRSYSNIIFRNGAG